MTVIMNKTTALHWLSYMELTRSPFVKPTLTLYRKAIILSHFGEHHFVLYIAGQRMGSSKRIGRSCSLVGRACRLDEPAHV